MKINRLSKTAILLTAIITITATGCKKEKQKQEENQEADTHLLNKIIYAAGNSSIPFETQFFTMNSDGTDEKQLTSFPSPSPYYLYLGEPSWSPDGTKILFISNKDGKSNYEIYIMNADGTGEVRLTNDPRLKSHPSFSPDGKSILFTSSIDPLQYIYQLFTMNTDGTDEKQLTFFKNQTIFNYTVAGEWSPDGKKIVFISNKDDKLDNLEIYIMNSDGTGANKLTTQAMSKYFPTYSPDGSKILFQGNTEGKKEQHRLFTINSDGSGEKQITNNQTIASSARWSPDGKKIVFVNDKEGPGQELCTINADGTGMAKLNTKLPEAYAPFWR